MTVLDSSSLKFWESFETLGFLMVLLGVVFEGIEHWGKFKKGENVRKKRLEKKGWLVLVVGLAIELIGGNMAWRISDRINAELLATASRSELKAAQANERTATIESNNLVLQAKVEQLKARRISVKQEKDFIDLLKFSNKGPVRVLVGPKDSETEEYAREVRAILDESGYYNGRTNNIEYGDFNYVGGIGDTNEVLPLGVVVYATNNDALSMNLPGVKFTYRNGLTIMSTQLDETNSVIALIDNALNKINITPILGGNNTFLKPGEWAIFIPQKF
ncbi:MAG TPA: hypothetical protein VNX46_01875 [Candidatus Acidoferrum sp.]|jgi:hypothetical protein|nr:hypothetical protein [Candidatus Acidoferrum sp.]